MGKHNTSHMAFLKGVVDGGYILHGKFDATISTSYTV